MCVFELAKLPSENKVISTWDMEKPLVSIACLTYNHASFLPEAVYGFLKQKTSFPFEIIFHDDASSDDTQKIIIDLQSKYPKIIKFVFQPVNIYSSGGNILLYLFSACEGKYIAFCEGDDYWVDPDKLEQQVSFLELNPSCSIVYSDCQPFHDDESIDVDYGGARRSLTAQELREAPSIFTLTSCFRNVICIPPEAAMSKYGDMFMWSLLGEHGSGEYLPSPLPSKYRVHAGGIHSSSGRIERVDMTISTYVSLMMYHKRVGNVDLVLVFRDRLFRLCVREIIRRIPGVEALLWLRNFFIQLGRR